MGQKDFRIAAGVFNLVVLEIPGRPFNQVQGGPG
jgi:hypothetical protein